MRRFRFALLAFATGCLIPVTDTTPQEDAGPLGGGGGGGSGGSAGGGGSGGFALPSDSGVASPFDGGTGHCSALVDGGWRVTWAGNTTVGLGPDGGLTSAVHTQWVRAVWANSPTDVWAVGSEAVSQTLQALILHWDGTRWTQVPTGSTPSLYDVWGTGPNDVWAVGLSGTVLHWNGAAWLPTAVGTSRHLASVWGTGPNDVFLVGGDGVHPPSGAVVVRWDGAAWSQTTVPGTWPLTSVHGTGPSDIWAVGSTGTVLHFDGTGWASRAQGAPPRQLLAVRALSSSNVWVGADFGTLLHWDGTGWIPRPAPTAVAMFDIWGHQADALWSSDGSSCLRWNGSSWKQSLWGLGPSGGITGFGGTGPDDVWAVGTHILHSP